MQYCSLQHQTLLLSLVITTTGCCFCFGSIPHSFWSYFSTDLQQHIGHLPTWEVHLSVSYLFAFSYCSWGSQGKNTAVVCHSLLQWTTFCQTSPPCLHLSWVAPHSMAFFIELDKAVVCVKHGFDPWVRKNPWKSEWQPTPVFLPGEFHG